MTTLRAAPLEAAPFCFSQENDMSDITAIVAELRDRAGKGAARATRRTGKVPGVIYGAKQAPICIQIDPRIVWAQITKPGFYTNMFEIDLGAGGKHRCLARDIQMHPVTDQPVHVDFMRVATDSVIHVKVPVHFINEAASLGLKRGGVLNVETHEIEVTCSPENIPHAINIDVGGMDIGDSVHFSQIVLPEGVKPYHMGAKVTVVSIAAPTVARAGEVDATAAAATTA
jgi:large subunit ribosomal protein L25